MIRLCYFKDKEPEIKVVNIKLKKPVKINNPRLPRFIEVIADNSAQSHWRIKNAE